MTAQRYIETQADAPHQASLLRCLGERFAVEALVGSGGMGLVFRCRDLLDGKKVAVKVLQRLEYIAGERFAREAEVLADLVHPGIVRYVAHGVTPQGEPYLAMEWLDGETLADRIAQGPVPAASAARLGAKVLQALALAHARGIVHRDIKPSNLFLPAGDLDQVKLIDFGIAARAHSDRPITRAAVGTPLYMAPEQHGDGSKVDGRADVFSLGCVLFECVTGDPPRLLFDPDGRDLAIAWNPATLAALREGLPEPLRATLGHMLALAPGDRPSDLEKLALELRLGACEASQPARPKARTLSGNEQRAAAVAVVAGLETAGEDASRFAALAANLQSHGGKLGRTADGLWTIGLVSRAAPGDLASQMARFALRVRATFARARVAIATSRADLDSESALADLVAKAARTLADATDGAICGDPSVGPLLEGRFELKTLPGGNLHLCRERDLRDVPSTLMGKDIPCFGREREISSLEDLWQDACDSTSARVVLVTGPAGGGKSRVRYEFCQRIEGNPVFLLLGRGDPMHDSAPFALLGPALLAAAGIAGDEPEATQRERLVARVNRVLPGEPGRRTAAFLGEIANLPFPDDDLPSLRAARKDARGMADQRLMAWLDWLEAECEQQPVLLVLEDLHWADGPSVAFADAALRVLAQRPFMVLALARPEIDQRFPNLWAARNPQRIGLGPLSVQSSRRMVEHVAGAIPEATSRWIVDRAQGSPFFLQELLRVVAEGGQVGDDSRLPETVLGMVQARLDGLGQEAKLVLRAGSVFGESFRAAGVKTLLDQERRGDVDLWLDILEQQEVVLRRRGSELGEYAFRHALLRQAAYELLSAEQKRLGHLLAGQYLVAAGERDGSVLADHFEKAGDSASAVTWLAKAAEQALDANDIAQALARADKAVKLGAAGEELCRLKLAEARALYWKGEYPGAEVAARAALVTTDSRNRLLALTALFDALGPQAKYDEIAEEQRRLARPSEPALLRPWLEAMGAAAAYLSRGTDPAHGEAILAFFEQERERLDPFLVARHESSMAQAARKDGLLSSATKHFRRAADQYEAIGLPLDSCVAFGNLACSHLELGQLEVAADRLRGILETARRLNLRHILGGGLVLLANVLAFQGSFAEARACGIEACTGTRAHNDCRFQGSAEAYLSVTEYLAGNYTLAESYARDAMATWEAVPLARPFAVAQLARALVAQGRPGEAVAHARDAFAQLEKLGSVDDGEATIRLALAESLLASNDREAGREAAASAAKWLLARADKIDEPAHRESFLTRIPEHRRILELAGQ